MWSFEYGLPKEDTAAEADELPDSRTHQFFALCRDGAPADAIPMWAYLDDAERAQAAGILGGLPPDSQILELAPGWQMGHGGVAGSCVHAIEPGVERHPTTCVAADGPVQWDTGFVPGAVPGGAYLIYAHTFEPLPNLWTVRAGVVRIHDGDPDAVGPAVGLLSPSVAGPIAFDGEGFEVRGCLAGMTGTTATLEWTREANPTTWMPIGTVGVQPDQCAFELRWMPPLEAVGSEVRVRATAVDPEGRQFTVHSPGTVTVLAGPGPGDDPDPPGFEDVCGGPGDDPPGPASCDGIDPGTGTTGSGGSDGGTGDTTAGDGMSTGPADGTSAATGGPSGGSSTSGHASSGTDTAGNSAGATMSTGVGPGEGTESGGCACVVGPGRADVPMRWFVWVMVLFPTLTKSRRRAI